ncbi:MAG: (d)CMP kinase [Mariprofundaceae bacterium]
MSWQVQPGLRIAIDGPSGSGKGTVALMLGVELGLPVLDTGLLYRFLGWRTIEEGLAVVDEKSVLALLESSISSFVWHVSGIEFEEKDCTESLRGEDVAAAASVVAAMPAVREKLLDVQRNIAAHGCVMDGRDVGTVVLPDAEGKFFLTAKQRERARRRWSQLQQKGEDVSLDQIMADLKARDERDAGRDCAPLVKAVDAIQIDSTTMRADEVIDRILAVLERKKLISNGIPSGS